MPEDQQPSKASEGSKTSKSSKAAEADPETLHTTDPQEHMTGPISNWMQRAKKKAETNDNQPKEVEKHDHKSSSTGGDFINK